MSLLLLALLLCQDNPGVDWPSFLGPNRDGTSPERGIKPWPVEGPRRRWQRVPPPPPGSSNGTTW